MRHLSAGVALVVVSVALLAGCGGSSLKSNLIKTGPIPKANLTGGIRFTGRIPPGYAKTGYQRGLVQILRQGRVIASAHLSQGQGYRFVLGTGAYDIRTWGNAKPAYPPCPLTAVTIRRGRTAHANVFCEFH